MTLQSCFNKSSASELFAGTVLSGWHLSAEEHYRADDDSRLHPTHFSLEIKVDAVPALSKRQKARFERALRACPVLTSLKQDVIVTIC